MLRFVRFAVEVWLQHGLMGERRTSVGMGLPVERTCYSLSLAVASVSVVVYYDLLRLKFCVDVMWCYVVLIEQTRTHNHHSFSELWLCIGQHYL